MPDEPWSLATPREEMLERVAARGSRIRVIRGLVNALAVLTALGLTGAGVGVAIRWGVDDGISTEVDGVALGPQPPSGGPSTSPMGSGPAYPPAQPDRDAGSGGADRLAGPQESATTSSAAPGARSTTTATVQRPATSTSPSTSTSAPVSDPTSSTTTVDGTTGPNLRHVRLRTGEKPLDLDDGICANDAGTTISADVEGAEAVTVTWSSGATTERISMVSDDTVWSAGVGDAAVDRRGPVTMVVEAVGDSGVTSATFTVDVVSCTPASAPSEPDASTSVAETDLG